MGPSCSSHQLLRSRRCFDALVTVRLRSVCNLAPSIVSGAGSMPEDEVSLEDLIAIERVAQKLWEEATKGTATGWEIIIRSRQASMAQSRADGGHHLAQVGRRTLTGSFSSFCNKTPCMRSGSTRTSVSPLFSGSAQMRFRLLVVVAMLAACGPRLPPPNSADARYDGQQRGVQVRVSSLQPPTGVALVASDGTRYPAAGIALLSGPHVLYNPPPSIGLGIGGFGFSGCCSALWLGAGRRGSRRTADAGRNKRPVCRLGLDPFAARLRNQLEPIPRGGLGRWAGYEYCRPSSCGLSSLVIRLSSSRFSVCISPLRHRLLPSRQMA